MSVHAFAQSTVGPILLCYLGLIVVGGFALLASASRFDTDGVVRNDDYRNDDKVCREVALVRDGLREAGLEEVGFGTSHDGYSWALLVKTDTDSYNTLVGTIRADVGMRLNRLDAMQPDGRQNPDPGDRFAFHFSLGEAF